MRVHGTLSIAGAVAKTMPPPDQPIAFDYGKLDERSEYPDFIELLDDDFIGYIQYHIDVYYALNAGAFDTRAIVGKWDSWRQICEDM